MIFSRQIVKRRSNFPLTLVNAKKLLPSSTPKRRVSINQKEWNKSIVYGINILKIHVSKKSYDIMLYVIFY